MSRFYFDIETDGLKSEELAKLIRKVQALTQDGYETAKENYELLMNPLKKILRLSKQEEEWFLYFWTISEILVMNRFHSKHDEMVKYAEIYYKESALHMDREIANCTDPRMAYLNTWIYDEIYGVYSNYHQIDDAKMDSFMEKFEASALKYGKAYKYYDDAISLSLLYRDADGARIAARKFKQYENEMQGCYVCGHRQYLAHLILTDENRQAEEMMLDLINKNIPKQRLWCYEYCAEAVPDQMYEIVLYRCVGVGKESAFRYFYDKYWKKMAYEVQWNESKTSTFRRLLCAAEGMFEHLKEDLRLTEEDIRKTPHFATTVNMEIAIAWWCYFTLLDRTGVHEVELSLPGLEADGKVPTLTVATYMEKRADEFGALFSKARARFDYEGLKGTYRKCFLSEN
ncbi:MAG: hypothetical protein J1E03_12880 [Acetatifactor sp.]|nr:hypothetical protein [Acetatifactor sp.]